MRPSKVVNRGGKWYVVGDHDAVLMGPFVDASSAARAMNLQEALVTPEPPDQGTKFGSEDAARRGPPGDAFANMDKVPLSPEVLDRLRERLTPEVDMSLDPVMERLQEIGGPRKASHGEPGTSGQGRFEQTEAERRRQEDQGNVKTLERIRARSLRDALLGGR